MLENQYVNKAMEELAEYEADDGRYIIPKFMLRHALLMAWMHGKGAGIDAGTAIYKQFVQERSGDVGINLAGRK